MARRQQLAAQDTLGPAHAVAPGGSAAAPAPARDRAPRRARLRLGRSDPIELATSSATEAADTLAAMLAWNGPRRSPDCIGFMNMRNFMAAVRNADVPRSFRALDLVFADGVGMQIARWVLGLTRYERVSGTDVVPMLLHRVPRGTRVFLLGGTPRMCDEVARRFPGLFPAVALVGVHHGFFGSAQDDEVVRRIEDARPDLLVIGMGTPIQEFWLERNKAGLSAKVAVCVGGLFQYWANDLHRAPPAVRRIGLEWLWILVQQPAKWRIYTIDAVVFLARLVQARRALH